MFRGFDTALSFVIFLLSLSVAIPLFTHALNTSITATSITGKEEAAEMLANCVASMIKSGKINVTKLMESGKTQFTFSELGIPRLINLNVTYGAYLIIKVYKIQQTSLANPPSLTEVWTGKVSISASLPPPTTYVKSSTMTITNSSLLVYVEVYVY